ncbi:MAG: transporter substrate-binding domain-containing protein [Cetobacterium sp.]
MKKIILLVFVLLNTYMFAEKNINIGIPTNYTDMFLYKDLDKGEYQGVYVDIISEMNKKLQLFKEVEYSLNGESDATNDIILRTIETTQGAKKYTYIDTPMIYRIAIVVKKTSKLTNIGDMESLKVAYVPGNHGIREITERYSGINLEKVEVKNLDEGLEYLESGAVDAFIVQDWSDKNSGENNFKTIENFKYNEQLAVKNEFGESSLKIKKFIEELPADKLQNIIKENRVKFYKYLLKETPSYEYILENYKDIKVRIGKDEFMLPFYYKQKNTYQGLTVNIIKELENIIGVPFVYTKQEEFDVNGIAIENIGGKSTYNYTKPYYEMKLSIANRKSDGFVQSISDLDKSKVLVLKGDYSYEYLKKVLKNSELIQVETYDEGLDKLLNQDGDYLVGYFNILTGAITNNFLDEKIKVAGILNESFGVSLAIKKSDEALSNVLSTILESFTVDKTVANNKLLKNSIVAQNYRLIAKIAIPTIIFILILIALIIKSEKNRKKAEELSYSLIEVLEMANQLNDEDTGDHVKRLGMYSTLLSQKINVSEKLGADIKRFSSLHDIGKVAIPSEILKKPSKLTDEEFKKVKEHVNIGHDLVKKLKLGSVAENIVRYHHEKWDGTGYPLGLKGEEIPLEARIVSIVDVYDALRQNKSHREGISHKEALEIIKSQKGKSFDPELVDAFVKNDKEFEKIYEENKEALNLATEFYSAIKNK